jgi:hypothetical protein
LCRQLGGRGHVLARAINHDSDAVLRVQARTLLFGLGRHAGARRQAALASESLPETQKFQGILLKGAANTGRLLAGVA